MMYFDILHLFSSMNFFPMNDRFPDRERKNIIKSDLNQILNGHSSQTI